MKKYLALATLLGTGLIVSAQTLMGPEWHSKEATLQRHIATQQLRAVQQTMNTSLTVEIPITKQYFPAGEHRHIDFANSAEYRTWRNVPTYTSTVGCKAYALDNHWLIAGAACLWNGRHTVIIDNKYQDTGLTEVNLSTNGTLAHGSIKIDGKSVETDLFIQPRFTLLPHVILIRIPQKNTELASAVQQMPKINILAFTQQNPMDLQDGIFYANTSRFGLNTNQMHRLKAYDRRTGTMTIKENFDDWAVLSNDPLFYVKDNVVYWIGINKGVMKTTPNGKWDGQSSDEFVGFTNADLEFIQQTLTGAYDSTIEDTNPAYFRRYIAPRLYRK